MVCKVSSFNWKFSEGWHGLIFLQKLFYQIQPVLHKGKIEASVEDRDISKLIKVILLVQRMKFCFIPREEANDTTLYHRT